jgi:mRNA interferase MazF
MSGSQSNQKYKLFMNIKQGDIYLADLNPIKGHEQAGLRPVLVLQNNILNKNLTTIITAPITSNLKAKGKLTTFFLSKKISKLNKDSVALLFQIRTLDKSRFKNKITSIKKENLNKIKKQIKFIF